MADLKRNQVFVFEDGQLTVKIAGHEHGNGWGEFTFHERQVEIDADGFHKIEIPPSELRELRDFLTRVLAEGQIKDEPTGAEAIKVEIMPIGTAASEVRDGIQHTYALRANGDGWVYRSRSGPKAHWCPIPDATDVPQRFKDAIAGFMAEHPASELAT